MSHLTRFAAALVAIGNLSMCALAQQGPAKGGPPARGGRLGGTVQGAAERRLAAHDATPALPTEATNVEDAQLRTLCEAAQARSLTVAPSTTSSWR